MSKHLTPLMVLVVLVSAACSSSGSSAAVPAVSATDGPTAPATTQVPTPSVATPPAASAAPTSTPTAGPSATPVPGSDAAGILWLCMPGQPNNPCQGDLSTTVIDSAGKRTIQTPKIAANPKIDCFYVYPTVSLQPGLNATIQIDPEERRTAIFGAALFSQVCKVYAPVYPQLTIKALTSTDVGLPEVQMAMDGVTAAFEDYLANYNHGRGFVVIGHSQGAMLLISLLQHEVDYAPQVRKRLVSALLIGGNVTTAPGKAIGGAFDYIPTCGSVRQLGCVVGFSTFAETPPEDAAFGRTTSTGMLRPPRKGEQIVCVNPALPGGVGKLQPILIESEVARFERAPQPLPTTTYVAYPGEFSAECKTSGTASWLQVTRIGPENATPAFAGSEGPTWGLHDLDVALTLGNLVELVRAEAAAYRG